MAFRIAISELGITNDDTVIEGATPGDVWMAVRKHLHDKHDIDIPDVGDAGGEGLFAALPPRFDTNAVAGQQGPVIAAGGKVGADDDRGVATIVTRLVEKLRMGQQGSGSDDIVPPGASQSILP